MPFFPPTRNWLALVFFVMRVSGDILRNKPAAIRSVCDKFAQLFYPPPRILDPHHIPTDTPFLLVFNHYDSARAAAWWAPLLAASEIARRRTAEPRDIHFVMAREWSYADALGRKIKQPLTEWTFARLANAYGFVTVPPILDHVSTRGQGVPGVRRAMAMTCGDSPALLGIAPEGRGGPDSQLCEPPGGTGLFLLLLAREKIPLLPLGIYENGGALTLRFGAPFYLQDSRARERTIRDRDAATCVMQRIAALLPASLHGKYSPSKISESD